MFVHLLLPVEVRLTSINKIMPTFKFEQAVKPIPSASECTMKISRNKAMQRYLREITSEQKLNFSKNSSNAKQGKL